MIDYLKFISQKYEDLIEQPEFTSLITGNIPSKIEGFDGEFYIKCFIKGLEFHFNNETQILETIIIDNKEYFSYGLKNSSSRSDVLSILGGSSSSQEEKKVPVIGIIGAWDKYSFDNGYYQQISYCVGSDSIECVFYGKDD